MAVPRANARAFASSVLPQPGGPSTRTGFFNSPATYTWESVTSSTMYLASRNFWRSSSTDGNTFCSNPSQDSKGRAGFHRKTGWRRLGEGRKARRTRGAPCCRGTVLATRRSRLRRYRTARWSQRGLKFSEFSEVAIDLRCRSATRKGEGKVSRNFGKPNLKAQLSKLRQNHQQRRSEWQPLSQLHDVLRRSVFWRAALPALLLLYGRRTLPTSGKRL